MTTEESARLDRLEGLAETLLQIAHQQQTQSIKHEGEIGDLKQSTTNLQIATEDLRASTQDLRASIVDVVGMIGTLAHQQSEIVAEVRGLTVEVRGIATEVRGLQLESCRILDYLFNQQGGETP